MDNKMPPSVQTIFNQVYTQEIHFPLTSLLFPCSRSMRETIPYTDFLANHVDRDQMPCSEVPDKESRLTVSVCSALSVRKGSKKHHISLKW